VTDDNGFMTVISLDALGIPSLAFPTTVTIGVFDGVHAGHQALIANIVRQARASHMRSVVITFFPHPDRVLHGLTGRHYLTTPDERELLLRDLGVDHVYTLRFDERLRQVRAAQFVDLLVTRLHMRSLWVGADFALGYKREGDVAFLRQQGEQRGFTLQTIELLYDAHTRRISSTSIREALAAGDVALAAHDLGRPYTVSGEVVHGQARGRSIGYPTANIAVWEELVIPANGVYAGWASIEGDVNRYAAATNVGQRPTFDGSGVTVEAYLLDFEGDLYGKRLTFSFEKRLRPELKFTSIEALIAQIDADAEATRQLLLAR
jgi:riboflavin kinase/FMN adenylyltransferase